MAARADYESDVVIKKKAYHHGDLRRAIIVEAIARVRKDGEHAIVLREIAAEIGVSATAAYRHFTNRQQLVEEVAARGYRAMDEAITLDPVTGAGSDPALAAYLDFRNACVAMLEFAARERPWNRMMLEHLGTSELVADAGLLGRERLQMLIQRGVDAGVFRDDADLATDKVFWAGIDGLGTLVIFRVYPGESLTEVLGDSARTMFDLATTGMLTDAGRDLVSRLDLPLEIVTDASRLV